MNIHRFGKWVRQVKNTFPWLDTVSPNNSSKMMPPSVSAKTFFENIRILRYYELLFQVFLTETLFLFRSGSVSLAACETVTDVPCDIQDYEYHNTEFSFISSSNPTRFGRYELYGGTTCFFALISLKIRWEPTSVSAWTKLDRRKCSFWRKNTVFQYFDPHPTMSLLQCFVQKTVFLLNGRWFFRVGVFLLF